MDEISEQQMFRKAALRAGLNPFFVARDLKAYQASHGMQEEELADWLGCPPDQLVRLALCRRPDTSTPMFREEVERIALHVGADRLRLAQLFREMDALTALKSSREATAAVEERGYLVAARDRDEEGAEERESGAEDPGNEQDTDHAG